MPDARSEARKATSSATSAVSRKRLPGCEATISAMTRSRVSPRSRIWSASWFSTIGVRIHPGATTLAVSPTDAPSRAATRIRPKTACFAATYAGLNGSPTSDRTEPMAMIRPPGRLVSEGQAYLMARKGPFAITFMSRSQSCSA